MNMINKKGNSKYLIFSILLLAIGLSLVVIYTTPSDLMIVIAFIVLVLATLSGLVYLFVYLFSKTRKLRQLLKEIEHITSTTSFESLKERYLQAYNIYLKLSEKQKQNFFGKLNIIRETVEEFLKTQKKLELALERVLQGTFDQQKKNFAQLTELLQKLPLKEQEKYFSKYNLVKEKLEKGV